MEWGAYFLLKKKKQEEEKTRVQEYVTSFIYACIRTLFYFLLDFKCICNKIISGGGG